MNNTTVYCDICGAANRIQSKFCFSCGNPMRTTSTHAQSNTVTIPIDDLQRTNPTGLLSSNHVLNSRYYILEQIGKGGMSAVYKAKDILLGDRLVAIKEMSQSGLSPQDRDNATKAFKMEALTLARLKHPSLPNIYDHFYENDHWYLVMDFIEGETLEDRLSKNNHRISSLKEVLHIGEQLCLILEYLHSQQPPIIFRDLKPANVMLTSSGHLYLIDFGIVRAFKPGQAKDTIALGSPGYAAPEQYGRAQTTVCSDIYSLGVILYQMITGRDPSLSPFNFPPIQPDNALTKLIMQMIENDANKRPNNILVVKNALQLFKKALNMLPQSGPKPPLVSNSSTTKEKMQNPAPALQQFKGSGQKISPQFTLPSGLAIFRMKHNGARNFIITLLDSQGKRVSHLVNKIGNFDGAYALNIGLAGKYILNIQADGRWEVTIEQQISQPVNLPKTLEGSGQQVSSPFKLSQGLATFRMKHSGKRNFIITLLDSQGKRVSHLVNKIGNFDGAYALGVKQSGIYLLNIQADGHWKIIITQ